MIDISTLQKFDIQKMYKVYDVWPQIAREQYETNLNGIDFGEISHVVFAGMGGSGTIGDVFSAILSKTNIHVDVIKGYVLPKTVDAQSLVITTSVSGNTKETLNILNMAADLKCKTIAFSDDGKMQKICSEKGLTHRKIAMKHSPRASFPAFLFSILRILEPFLPINKNDIINSIDTLEKQREHISSTNLTDKNPALSLAYWISEIPLIYYPWGLQAAAIRFKNSLQENAKIHVITEDMVEACHNGVVSWEKNSIVQPILIQGHDDYIKTKERWQILKKYFENNKIEYREIISVEGNIISKLMNLIYLLDYASIYKAILDKTDPSPVRSIDYMKSNI